MPRKIVWGCAAHFPYLMYDQNLRFLRLYYVCTTAVDGPLLNRLDMPELKHVTLLTLPIMVSIKHPPNSCDTWDK